MVSATKGVLQLAGSERLKGFANSYCDNEGKIKEKKKGVNSGSIFFSHVSSPRIFSTLVYTLVSNLGAGHGCHEFSTARSVGFIFTFFTVFYTRTSSELS